MRGRIQVEMPYFKRLSLGYCDVAIVPSDNWLGIPKIATLEAMLQDYTKKEGYRIKSNYYNQRSIAFDILLKDTTRYQINAETYRIDWRFLHKDKVSASYIYEPGQVSLNFPVISVPSQPKTICFYISIPSVVTVGEHILEVRIFGRKQRICDWEGMAYFNICDADLDEHDKSLLWHGALVGAVCAGIGAAIIWTVSNLSTIVSWLSI